MQAKFRGSARRAKCRLSSVSLLLVLSFLSTGLSCCAAGKSDALSTLPEAQLEAVERKLLQRAYAHDPTDKRLQRLELLVFGATQFGSESERWSQLQKTLAERSKEEKGSRHGQTESKSSNNASRDLNLLEQEVLKKTFANESANQRLNRLEAKLFGQPSAGMTVERRIERLKRTTGLVDSLEGSQTAVRPFSQGEGNVRPFASPYGQMMPGFPDFGGSDPQMRELLREMDRQMRGFDRFGDSGRPGLMPNPRGGQFKFKFYYQGPDGKPHIYESPGGKPESTPAEPKGQKRPIIPGLKVPNTHEIPPYGDPNSI